MGDRILKVNGTDVTNCTHEEAVMELLRPCDEIKLTIQHDELPEGFQVFFKIFSTDSFNIIFIYLCFQASENCGTKRNGNYYLEAP